MLPQPTIYDQLITIKWKNKEKVRHELCWRNYELNRMVFLGRLRHFVKQFSLVFNEDHAICQVHLVLVSVHFLCLLSSAFPFLYPSLGFFARFSFIFWFFWFFDYHLFNPITIQWKMYQMVDLIVSTSIDWIS